MVAVNTKASSKHRFCKSPAIQTREHIIEDFFFCLFSFLGPHPWHMEAPGPGVHRSCSRWPTPQPQQCGIRVASATYTTAHSNTTHRARPGIEHATSWFPVGFANSCAMTGTPNFFFETDLIG